MKYSSIAIIAIAAAAKLTVTSGAPPIGKDVLLDTEQSRLLGKGGKKDKGLKRQVQQLEAMVAKYTNDMQECNDELKECNELRPTSVDYSLEKYGDDYCQNLAEKSNDNTLAVCNHVCPIEYSNGWLIPGNCDATGKCVAACRSLEGGKCGDGFEWRDSQLIAKASLCRLGECQDVECEPIDISDASQCCFNSPYCVPENDGVGELPLPYKCQATPPVCLKLGDVCRTDYVNGDPSEIDTLEEAQPPTSEGDCCGLYCSVVNQSDGDPKLNTASISTPSRWTATYTCQEEQVLPYWSTSYPPPLFS